MVAGAVGVAVAWRLIAVRRASVWSAMTPVLVAAGAASLVTGRVEVSPKVDAAWSALAGAAAGMSFYAATLSFVALARRVRTFARHVEGVYDQRGGLSVPVALALASLTAVGEELFWRGLFQGEVSGPAGRYGGAVVTWGTYVAANAFSGNLSIVAGAVVGGAVWGGLAVWTGGVLASMVCHGMWTALLVAFPPRAPS